MSFFRISFAVAKLSKDNFRIISLALLPTNAKCCQSNEISEFHNRRHFYLRLFSSRYRHFKRYIKLEYIIKMYNFTDVTVLVFCMLSTPLLRSNKARASETTQAREIARI